MVGSRRTRQTRTKAVMSVASHPDGKEVNCLQVVTLNVLSFDPVRQRESEHGDCHVGAAEEGPSEVLGTKVMF